MAELGIGVAHPGPTLTPDSLTTARITALDPHTRAKAKTVAESMRTDDATTAAPLLLDNARTHTPPTA